jgi:hypothetical protein
MSSSTQTEQFVELQVVYNGQPKDYRANVHQPLRPIFQRALADLGLQPAQPEEYGLFVPGRNDPLALDSKIADLGLNSGTVLHLQRRTPPRGG